MSTSTTAEMSLPTQADYDAAASALVAAETAVHEATRALTAYRRAVSEDNAEAPELSMPTQADMGALWAFAFDADKTWQSIGELIHNADKTVEDLYWVRIARNETERAENDD